jgi:trigger factor
LEEQALDQLIAAHPFEVPPSLIRQEQENLFRDQIQFMQSHGLQPEGLDLEKMLERLKPKAERRVRARLIFDKIAAQESVVLSQEEFEEGLAKIAERSGRPTPEVRKFYEENDLMGGLNRQLRDEKVMQLILDAATLTPWTGSPDQETT